MYIGSLAGHDINGETIIDISRTLLSFIVLVANIPGTLHPKLLISGINASGLNPIELIALATIKTPLARYPLSFSIEIKKCIEKI